ncbi:MAG: radical SAM protein [Candidatus Korobacteraceae bacterium]
MYFSRYNLAIPLDQYPEHMILHNVFHGQVSLISTEFFERISRTPMGDFAALTPDEIERLKDRRFLYDSEDEEETSIKDLYARFCGALASTNPTRQYQILLTYDCNLRCTYCFQKKTRKSATMSLDQLNRVLALISKIDLDIQAEASQRSLRTKPPLISVVGGEPMQDSATFRELVIAVARFAEENHFAYGFTSNGVDLRRFVPLFTSVGLLPNDVQVTLDGTRATHDRRRPKLNGGDSFDDIIEGIGVALQAGIHISLRVNLDTQNIDCIEELAELIVAKGWNRDPNFEAYLAPVTDHTGVNRNYKWMPGETLLIETIARKFKEQPRLSSLFQVKNFRGFNYVNDIVEDRGLPAPTFWRCEAILGQLIFDPLGDIYSCFEGAGNEDAKVGSYEPEFRLDAARLAAWKELDSYTSRPCAGCRFKFVCAGECPWHIIHQGETECLPIEREIHMAWNFFADKVIERLGAGQPGPANAGNGQAS